MRRARVVDGRVDRLRPPSAVAIAVTSVLLLAGCSGASSPGDGATRTAPSSPGAMTASGSATPAPASAEHVTAQVLGNPPTTAPIASVTGNLTVLADEFPAVAEVLEVRAGAASTLLRWRLKSAAGPQTGTRGSGLSRPPLFDTRGVSLRDAVGKQVLTPFTYVPQAMGLDLDTGCVCTGVPGAIGEDAEPMYALYPPLDPAATTVDVVLPGFAVAKAVPVTRR